MSGKQSPLIASKYEAIYGILQALAQSVLQDAPSADPAQAFAHLRDMLQAAWTVLYQVPGREFTRAEFKHLCVAHLAQPDAWIARHRRVTGTRRDRIRAEAALLVDAFKAHSPAGCDLVMDLGCGWGHRLLDVWTQGGPREAAYCGFERAPPALDIARLAAGLFPTLTADFFPFDFLRPDFQQPAFNRVAGAPRAVTVYSFHAIEQVLRLGDALFDALLARFPDATITGVHVEPVGFQAYPADPAWARDQAYAGAKHYNIDLYDRVRAHPRLEVLAFETDLMGERDGNSSSLLAWRSRRQ